MASFYLVFLCEQFYTLAVPVPPDNPGDAPAENPFGLPAEYAAVLQERWAFFTGLDRAAWEVKTVFQCPSFGVASINPVETGVFKCFV